MRRESGHLGWLVILSVVILSGVVGACSGAGSEPSDQDDAGVLDTGSAPKVAEIWMTPTHLRLALGESASVSANARDAAQAKVDGASIEWRSTDEDVVQVDQLGHVEAVGPGHADIEAVADGAVGRSSVQVYEPIASVEVILPEEPIHPGQTITPDFRLIGTLGNELSPDGFDIYWSMTSGSQVLEQRQEGQFVALRPGTTHISVVAEDLFDRARVDVGEYKDLAIYIDAPHIDADQWQLHRDESIELSARVFGSNGGAALPHVDVQWSSSDPSVVDLSEIDPSADDSSDDAVATGRRVGRARVIASAHGSSSSEELYVVGRYSRLDAGRRHVCGIYDGEAVCWGANHSGQLGIGDFLSRATPTPLFGGHSFVDIAAGDDFSCALSSEGQAFCWGDNTYGQLGDGTKLPHSRPAPVVSEVRFAAITAGFSHVCGLDVQGQAWCWGRGQDGRLGTGGDQTQMHVDRTTPAAVVGGHAFEAIDAGEHTCAIEVGGDTTWCWGDNAHGEIGATPAYFPGDSDGTASSAEPVVATTSKLFVSVSAGDDFSCALADDAQVYCWGSNLDDQLGRTIYHTSGDGVTSSFREVSWPVALHEDPVAYTAVDADYHPCAIREGDVYCWREDFHGDPTATGFTPVTGPVELQGVDTATSVTSGFKFTCAVEASGDAYCSGWGSGGVLGNGSRTGYYRQGFVTVKRPTLQVFE